MSKEKLLYKLRDDKEKIKIIQKAITATKKYGIKIEYGLFGSNEWWNAIDNGKIQVHTTEGIITGVWKSGHNDFPEFELYDGNNKTVWQLLGNEEYFVVGRKLQVKYVLTKNRFDYKENQTVVEIVLIQ